MTEHEWLTGNDPEKMLDVIDTVWPNMSKQTKDRKLRLFVEACREEEERLIRKEGHQKFIAWEPLEAYDPLSVARGWSRRIYDRTSPIQKAALLREIFGNPFRKVELCGDKEFVCDFCHGNKKCMEVKRVPVRGPEDIIKEKDCFACNGTGIQTHKNVHPCPLCQQIRTPDVLAVAQTIYDERRFEDMPILADALEEAKCDNEEILQHCRLPFVAKCPNNCAVVDKSETFKEFENNGPYESRWVKCPECNGVGFITKPAAHVRGCWALSLILGQD